MALRGLGVGDAGEVGGFRLHGRLGSGGMGAIYLGFDPSGAAVAVKTLPPGVEPGVRRRFTREAELLAGIRHPRVAALVDADVGSERPWLAMAYVPGPSLAEVATPLPAGRLEQLASGLAEALAVLQRAGVTHRDVKPSNVILTFDDLDMRRGCLTAAADFWDTHRHLIWSAASLDNRLEPALRHVELLLWCDDPAAAFREASTILQELCATGYSRFAGGLFVLALRACADAADGARASADAAAVNAALQDGDRLSTLLTAAKLDPFGTLPVSAHADAQDWQAESTRLRGEPDPGAWERSADAWEALPRADRAAYARWRQAEALLAQPYGRASATPVLHIAAKQAVQHAPLSTAIRDLARRARIELTDPEQAPVEQPVQTFGLTDREHAVLRLLSQGKTNAQIRAALFISAKTANRPETPRLEHSRGELAVARDRAVRRHPHRRHARPGRPGRRDYHDQRVDRRRWSVSPLLSASS
jgi:Protein kinase domain/Bacterial regulatory proteins, luxR family